MGITLLSEKAETIKVLLKETKDGIQGEEFKVKAVEEANKRVKEQIESLKRRQGLWQKKHETDLAYLVAQYDELSLIDIDKELLAHKDLAIYNVKKKQKDTRDSLLARQTAWKQKQDKDVNDLLADAEKLARIDIVQEILAHRSLVEYNIKTKELADRDKEVARLNKDVEKENKLIEKLNVEIIKLLAHQCYACGQDFHDEQHTKVLEDKEKMLADAQDHVTSLMNQIKEQNDKDIVLGDKPNTHYKTEAEAIRHGSEAENIRTKILEKERDVDPYAEQLTELPEVIVGPMPDTHYDTESQAIEHRSKVAGLFQQIEAKAAETDPYDEQVTEMESNALQAIDFEAINKLTKTMEHQKFLLDILTSKDSFVRKKIIDQNLSYLNSRLTHYLDKIGLPHQVVFQNDLTVEITELGRELDFDNLSRGERNRLILGLSFAFRDVWENLYAPINTLFIDELIDSGLDTMGVENAIAILKDMSRRRHKSIWLVSHREELAGRVPSVLKVVKENGFTTYSTAVDVE